MLAPAPNCFICDKHREWAALAVGFLVSFQKYVESVSNGFRLLCRPRALLGLRCGSLVSIIRHIYLGMTVPAERPQRPCRESSEILARTATNGGQYLYSTCPGQGLNENTAFSGNVEKQVDVKNARAS